MTERCGKEFETLCNRPKGHKGLCGWEADAQEVKAEMLSLLRELRNAACGNRVTTELIERVDAILFPGSALAEGASPAAGPRLSCTHDYTEICGVCQPQGPGAEGAASPLPEQREMTTAEKHNLAQFYANKYVKVGAASPETAENRFPIIGPEDATVCCCEHCGKHPGEQWILAEAAEAAAAQARKDTEELLNAWQEYDHACNAGAKANIERVRAAAAALRGKEKTNV